jgi:hypothetical protein
LFLNDNYPEQSCLKRKAFVAVTFAVLGQQQFSVRTVTYAASSGKKQMMKRNWFWLLPRVVYEHRNRQIIGHHPNLHLRISVPLTLLSLSSCTSFHEFSLFKSVPETISAAR